MRIGVISEANHENRVSLLPEAAQQLKKEGVDVWVETAAGIRSFATDTEYTNAGATISDRDSIVQNCDILLSIHLPEDADRIPAGTWLIGIYQPLYHPARMQELAEKDITVISMDMLPRTTRAQSMDVLSSQANIAGYKAVLLAAEVYPRYLPMLMTAAGTVPPAKVLILGAGVAGLQAIATARRLGAVVEVFDTRPAVKEEVMSLGAKFIEVEGVADASGAGGYAVEQSDAFKQKQQQRIAESVKRSDIIITTAQIPGKKAPLLITEPMIASMRNGSVIIDLAAATGGNVAGTENEKLVKTGTVTIGGYSNLASAMPADASRLYGKNLLNFIALLKNKTGEFALSMEDELIKGACISTGKKIVHDKISVIL